MTPNADQPDGRTIRVNDHEFGLIVSGLRKLRLKIARDMRRSNAAGFKPAPGKGNVPEMKAKTLRALMDRLGIDPKGDRS